MSADYTPPVEVVPDPTHATFYAWATESDGWTNLMTAVVATDGRDPETVARQYDPRKNKGSEGLRAALIKITVPLSEMRRLS